MEIKAKPDAAAMGELIRSMQLTLISLERASREWGRQRYAQDAATAWTEQYGEIVTKTTAAKILGCSPTTIYKLIDEGDIKTAPDGRVLVRSMAEWASCQSANRKAKIARKGAGHGKK